MNFVVPISAARENNVSVVLALWGYWVTWFCISGKLLLTWPGTTIQLGMGACFWLAMYFILKTTTISLSLRRGPTDHTKETSGKVSLRGFQSSPKLSERDQASATRCLTCHAMWRQIRDQVAVYVIIWVEQAHWKGEYPNEPFVASSDGESKLFNT